MKTESVLSEEITMWEGDDAKDLLEYILVTLKPAGLLPEHLIYRDGTLLCMAGTPTEAYRAVYFYTLGWGDHCDSRYTKCAIPSAPIQNPLIP